MYPSVNRVDPKGSFGCYTVLKDSLNRHEHECATYYVELFDKDNNKLKPRGRIGTDLINEVIRKKPQDCPACVGYRANSRANLLHV